MVQPWFQGPGSCVVRPEVPSRESLDQAPQLFIQCNRGAVEVKDHQISTKHGSHSALWRVGRACLDPYRQVGLCLDGHSSISQGGSLRGGTSGVCVTPRVAAHGGEGLGEPCPVDARSRV